MCRQWLSIRIPHGKAESAIRLILDNVVRVGGVDGTSLRLTTRPSSIPLSVADFRRWPVGIVNGRPSPNWMAAASGVQDMAEQTETAALLPCPFCGDPNVILDCFGHGPNVYAASCEGSCKCIGPEASTKEKAAEMWNGVTR